ncbi:dienelactone hydrolase [Hyaloscypha variabilis F]|uniref:Dienelactone hydrolase n=1 Tax=Hyaloscypha variabilis (strain UAMH 11265 / GT02V1 / F) TaxID=1149755 RepID=A0A2J6QY74_HYAVF|nr:dienelactone hydrolase [Hyaloscypha variabilis F]
MACEACKTIPPVLAEGYVPKGNWEKIGNLNTYVTGNLSSKRAIIDVYDIFGPAPQTLQGADALATALDLIVVVPDFFKGSPMLGEWYTNPTEESDKLKNAFLAQAFNFKNHAQELLDFNSAAKSKFASVSSWGAVGLCWGGKVVVILSGEGTPFTASGQVHPGKLEFADAQKLTIPHIVLASNGEPEEVVKQYHDLLVGEGKKNVVETYGTMHHGWMGARAKLGEEANLKEYTRG